MDAESTAMDKFSWITAVACAAVASLVLGGTLGPQAMALDSPTDDVPTAAPGAGNADACARSSTHKAGRRAAPTVVPPAGPSDVQVNASGTAAAGGAGTVPGDARGDPCEPAKRYGPRPHGASAAAFSTPTTLNRR